MTAAVVVAAVMSALFHVAPFDGIGMVLYRRYPIRLPFAPISIVQHRHCLKQLALGLYPGWD